MKKYFNKDLIMTDEENEQFEQSNICWICGNLIENTDSKVKIIVISLENIEMMCIIHAI